MKILTGLALGVALTLGAAACSDTGTNSNANANNNSALLTNNNGNANTAGVSTMNDNFNANANASPRVRNYNANVSRSEYESSKTSYAEDAKNLGSKIGTGTEDGWLWTKTRAALLTTSNLTSTGINIDVDNSVVTLHGTVPDNAQKVQAVKVARSVAGVKSVRDELTVSATGSNSNTNANKGSNTNTNSNHNTNHNTAKTH